MAGWVEWFWRDEVWLMPGHTWKSLSSSPHFEWPVWGDLWTYPFAIAGAMLALRYLVLEPFVLTPIAVALGASTTRHRPPPQNSVLERVFRRYKSRPPQDTVAQAAKDSGLTERGVERWLRQRGASARPTDVFKFNDCAWQAVYYCLYCVFGVVVLWDKPWLWDINQCWAGFPEQSVAPEVWWYYMVALGFYWSMTLTHFIQHQRKDTIQMFAHHIITISLITLSWGVNFVRLGSLVLLVHECADIPMLLAKMSGVVGRRDLMDVFFVIFVVLWLSTRTGLFPFWIMRNSMFQAHVTLNVEIFPVYYIFNGMFSLLLLIHIIWTYLILRIIYRKLREHTLEDMRSSSEESLDEDDLDSDKKEQ